MFVKKASSARLFSVKNAYHELLFERKEVREAALQSITDFFNQRSDDVYQVKNYGDFEVYDPRMPIYSVSGKQIIVLIIIVISSCCC